MTHPSRSTDMPERKVALLAGVFFILTFVTSIAAVILYAPILDDPAYVLGGGADTRIQLGALLEVFLMITNIGTAIVLFPVLKRHGERLALGYVAVRIVESLIIAVGFISLLSVLTLSTDAAGAPDGTLVVAGQSLVAVHDWTFLFGPAFCAGLGNGLILGYLMFKSGLVPRRMAMVGLVGGPMLFAAAIAVLFGAFEQSSGTAFLFTAPEIVWEAFLGIYLAFHGFKTGAAVRPAPVARPAVAAG
jgi:hypothetical protein